MKVGDNVRIVNAGAYAIIPNGVELDVCKVGDSYIEVMYNGDSVSLIESNYELIEERPERYASREVKIDPVVTSVMTQLLTRSQLGISKYGTTLEDNNTDDFLQHLKEELMDAVLYIEKLQREKIKRLKDCK